MSTWKYLMSGWSGDPVVIGVCIAALLTYLTALRSRLSAQAGYFVAGVVVLFVTLASPLNALADGYLFSAHMMQHMLLLLIVPALLLLGIPTMAAAKNTGGKRDQLHPVLAWIGGVGAMWLWHERTLCDLATRTETVRTIQTVSLLALGTLFWWPLLAPLKRQRVEPLTGVVYLFSACIACSVLGILITFSSIGGVCPIFLEESGKPAVLSMIRNDWGITPTADQQIGGLLMWVPGCGIYLTGVMVMLARWYGDPETGDAVVPQAARAGRPGIVSIRTGGETL